MIKILRTYEDKTKAEGYPSIIEYIEPAPWYVGHISRMQTDEMLMCGNQPDGAFLVHDIVTALPGQYSISVKYQNGFQHFVVKRDAHDHYYLYVVKFASLKTLVDYHRLVSVSRKQTILLKDMEPPVMYVEAQYYFSPESNDELAFKKKDVIRLIGIVDENWWKGELNNVTGIFPGTYVEMTDCDGLYFCCDKHLINTLRTYEDKNKTEGYPISLIDNIEPAPWYVGQISRKKTDEMLMCGNQPYGAFLVRDIATSPGEYSISIKHRHGVQHFRIKRDDHGNYYLYIVKFASLKTLVDYYRIFHLDLERHFILKGMEPHVMYVEAQSDFSPENDDELAFKKKDVIRLIGKVDENWWKGELNNVTGIFPVTYVEMTDCDGIHCCDKHLINVSQS